LKRAYAILCQLAFSRSVSHPLLSDGWLHDERFTKDWSLTSPSAIHLLVGSRTNERRQPASRQSHIQNWKVTCDGRGSGDTALKFRKDLAFRPLDRSSSEVHLLESVNNRKSVGAMHREKQTGEFKYLKLIEMKEHVDREAHLGKMSFEDGQRTKY
jgi:hypothetical protein